MWARGGTFRALGARKGLLRGLGTKRGSGRAGKERDERRRWVLEVGRVEECTWVGVGSGYKGTKGVMGI